MFYNFLIYIWLFLNFLTMVFCLYQLSVSLSAFRKSHPKAGAETEYKRFGAIIAARNEEKVIGNLIESIRLQDYPEGMIDVIVIADNCDDATAEAAEKAGAVVYKRYNRAQIGKGYVVRYALEKILAERDIYDAFCILDADNVVDRNFFRHMNRAVCGGAQVAQGYRDMKNPTDNWISGCHSIFYWMENRFFNFARSVQGLSATVNGTGFMMTRRYVQECGFSMKTITEDLELSIQCVIGGYKVEWVPEAKVYDEQPLTVQQSMTQRSRWINGFVQCFVKYFRPLLASIIKKPTGIKIDMFMFVSSYPIMIVGMGAIVMYFILGLFNIFDMPSTMLNISALAVGSVFAFWAVGWLSVLLEGKGVRRLLKAILTYPVFNVTWALLYMKCIFRPTSEWKPIIHARSISIQEIESTQK